MAPLLLTKTRAEFQVRSEGHGDLHGGVEEQAPHPLGGGEGGWSFVDGGRRLLLLGVAHADLPLP